MSDETKGLPGAEQLAQFKSYADISDRTGQGETTGAEACVAAVALAAEVERLRLTIDGMEDIVAHTEGAFSDLTAARTHATALAEALRALFDADMAHGFGDPEDVWEKMQQQSLALQEAERELAAWDKAQAS